MISIAVRYYPSEVDENMAYSDWIGLFKRTNWKRSRASKEKKSESSAPARKRNQKLRVTWPDGHTMQTKKPSDTFVYVIETNYPDLIMEIDFHRDVVSKEKFPDFPGSKRSQQYIESGYWVNTNLSLPSKVEILQKISDELGLGLKIEIVTVEE